MNSSDYDWDTLLPRVLHDGRAALRKASMKAQMLDRQWEGGDPELRQLLREVVTAQTDLDLFFRRISALREAYRPAREWVPLQEILLASRLSRKNQLAAIGAKLSVAEAPGIAAPGKLQGAIEELIDNSMRFAAEDRTLEIDIHAHLSADVLVVTVADNASGWDPAFTERAFMPLERLDPRAGFGLGLAIARAMIASAGGTIEAATSPAGSTFTVRIPTRG
jgi:signal transduction histidine kinase